MIKFTAFILGMFLILNTLAWGLEVGVDVEPNPPIKNEHFYVTFHLKVADDAAVNITFQSVGAKNLGKRDESYSTSTTIINGNLTVTRELNLTFELLALSEKEILLKNIKAIIQNKEYPLKDIKVSSESNSSNESTDENENKAIGKDVFIEAQISKSKLYVGEGADVNYYLYSKLNARNYEIKEFPKLNRFIKRFHKTQNNNAETVQYKGQIYRRWLVYSARVYPEKEGKAVVDEFKVSLDVSDGGFPFSGFFGNSFKFSQPKMKNLLIASKPLEITVLALPKDTMPKNFTGLVGEHEFNFSMNKNKFMVNEPIEYRLEVKGVGALENFDPPKVFEHDDVEKFDSNASIVEIDDHSSKKTYSYTSLGRSALHLPTREMVFSYFDPNNQKYVSKKIIIPEIDIAGIVSNNPSLSSSNKDNVTNSKKEIHLNSGHTMLGPIFDNSIAFHPLRLLNYILSLCIFIIAAIVIKNGRNQTEKLKKFNIHYRNFKKNPSSYSDITQLLNVFLPDVVNLNEGIEQLKISSEAKKYFKQMLTHAEVKTFSQNESTENLVINEKYFNEIKKLC